MVAVADPTLRQIENRLTQLLPAAVAYSGTVYRSCTPKYATEEDRLTGAGSKQHGGRWNPTGIAVVYSSLSPETAMTETLAHHRYYGSAVEDAMPLVFVATVVKLSSILDLRQGGIRQRLKISLDRIPAVDWRKEIFAGRVPITRLIGLAAVNVGLEGLVVPSAADPHGHNLLIFPENLHTGSTATVRNADKLRK